MAKSTRNVDVTSNGTTTQVPLIVDRNAQNEEAIARALVQNGELVNETNPLRVAFETAQSVTDAGIGFVNDVAAAGDATATGLVGLFKRLLARITTLFQGVAGTPNENVLTVQGIAGGTNLSVALPTGAATAAKQPALGTAGTPSADVLSFQGVPNGTALSVVDEPILHFANYATATRAGTAVLKSSPGRLIAIESDGTALATAVYLQIHAATAVPTAGARCFKYFPVLPGSLLVYGRKDLAIDIPTGITVVASTTRDTYTAVATGDLPNIYFTVSYR